MTARNRHRFNSFNYDRYDASVPTDYAEFISLLAPSAAAQLALGHYQEGDAIVEQNTGTKLQLIRDTTLGIWRWIGAECTIGIYLNVDLGPLPANRYVAGDNTATPPAFSTINFPSDFGPAIGITMNPSDSGDRVYVVEIGKWFVEAADQQGFIGAFQNVSTTTTGTAKQYAAPGAGGSRNYLGQNRGFITLNSLLCTITNVAQPVLQVVPA